MNENKNHSKQYSAEDIQRYLKGQMSAQDMHAIETAALDDPFLADAIEGFETAIADTKEDSIKTELGKLNREFGERMQQGKVVPITQRNWWKFAAAAAIVIVMGVAFYNNWIKPEQNADALAVNENKQDDSAGSQKPEAKRSNASAALLDTIRDQDKRSAAPSTSSKPIVSPQVPVQTENEPGNKIAKQKNSSPVKDDKETDDQALQNPERSEKVKEELSKKASGVEVEKEGRERQTEVAAVTSNEPIVRREKQSIARLNNFSGRVVDPDNKPLSNANLQILQNRTNLMTDQSGNFNFTTKDSVVDVQVALVGFEQRNFRLQNSIASNNLVLEPSKQNLDEVVVTGYGTRRKEDLSKITGKVQDAVPQIGWLEYEKYLQKNKKPPANNPLMKGEVVVSFHVKRQGGLSDFKIDKSLSTDYDTEAIRLIQEGPAWKLLNGRKTRITVIVKF